MNYLNKYLIAIFIVFFSTVQSIVYSYNNASNKIIVSEKIYRSEVESIKGGKNIITNIQNRIGKLGDEQRKKLVINLEKKQKDYSGDMHKLIRYILFYTKNYSFLNNLSGSGNTTGAIEDVINEIKYCEEFNCVQKSIDKKYKYTIYKNEIEPSMLFQTAHASSIDKIELLGDRIIYGGTIGFTNLSEDQIRNKIKDFSKSNGMPTDKDSIEDFMKKSLDEYKEMEKESVACIVLPGNLDSLLENIKNGDAAGIAASIVRSKGNPALSVSSDAFEDCFEISDYGYPENFSSDFQIDYARLFPYGLYDSSIYAIDTEDEIEKERSTIEFLLGNIDMSLIKKNSGFSINNENVTLEDGSWIFTTPEKEDGFGYLVLEFESKKDLNEVLKTADFTIVSNSELIKNFEVFYTDEIIMIFLEFGAESSWSFVMDEIIDKFNMKKYK